IEQNQILAEQAKARKEASDAELKAAKDQLPASFKILDLFKKETQEIENQITKDEEAAEFQIRLGDARQKIGEERAATAQELLNLDARAELASNQKVETEKDNATKSQKISLGNSIVSLAEGVANTVKAGFPINIPLLIGYFAQVAGIIGTIKSVKFEKGGHGVLDGPSHSQGGIHIPGVGEGQGEEYFGIINRQMTKRYSQELPAIFDSLNSGKFHDVWSNANIQLQTNIDPWTKKIYDTLQSTPNIYTDSNGDTIKEYPDGYMRVIKRA
ncbi:hypothetical protein LCGC14_2979250, partial [marine sediment metagenome]